MTDNAVPLSTYYAFTARAGARLEHIIHMFPDEVATNPGADDDLQSAVPL